MNDREEPLLRERLDAAFPAPAAGEIEAAWSQVIARVDPRSRWHGSMIRIAAAVALVGGGFAGGFIVGQAHHQPATELEVHANNTAFPIRPPELVPAHAVGGSS